MATITNGQMEIAGSLIIGDGTDFRLPVDYLQWWHAPDVRTGDVARTSTDGYLFGRDLLGKQVTTISVLICATSEAQLGDHIDAWKSACQATADVYAAIRWNAFGRTRQRFGRFRIPGDVTVDQWSLDLPGIGNSGCFAVRAYGNAQFEAIDPRTFGDTLNTTIAGRALPGAGITPPFTPPFTMPASSGGTLSLTNNGNTDAPWTARLDGPITNPVITHTPSGRTLAFQANAGLDLLSGQWVDIVSSRRSVLLNGTGDRRSLLTVGSQWWELAPGANAMTLAADAGSGTFTIGAYDAWLS